MNMHYQMNLERVAMAQALCRYWYLEACYHLANDYITHSIECQDAQAACHRDMWVILDGFIHEGEG